MLDCYGHLIFLLSKLIIGNTRGFIRGKALATLNDIPSTVDTYTKSQIDNKLNGKANTSHTHSQYVTTSQLDSIIANYSGNVALGTTRGTDTYSGFNITFSSSCRAVILAIDHYVEIYLRTSGSRSFTGFTPYANRHQYIGNTIYFDYPFPSGEKYGYIWFA